jgi:hypothetical protein
VLIRCWICPWVVPNTANAALAPRLLAGEVWDASSIEERARFMKLSRGFLTNTTGVLYVLKALVSMYSRSIASGQTGVAPVHCGTVVPSLAPSESSLRPLLGGDLAQQRQSRSPQARRIG